MVIGNFASGWPVSAAVNDWYLSVYADAYEWVELPNVTGMVLFADGGILASKPYAAGSAYIERMSDYCADCRYSPKEKQVTVPVRLAIYIGIFLAGMKKSCEAIPVWA